MTAQLDGSKFFFDQTNLSDRYNILANKVTATKSKITKTENALADFMKKWNATEVTSIKQKASIRAHADADLEVLHNLVKELGNFFHEIEALAHLRDPLPDDDPNVVLSENHEIMATAINVKLLQAKN